ncbi:sensor histidine kinase [Catenuloplanes atrovinosus]|uniref:histidine kinase n=1 Tax=Catenuloplanes atrovinosus TaxID=137266 RepID=A0AAE3YS64_9ACTN|nr:HAMP domain-containing sensor histidine kinase [Catenuloplanes atrovinosus]MDR7277652.1 signal transduction histidine kinase [Catenuloplanes atrovinosus]
MITWLILSALGFAGAQWVTDRNKREMEDRFDLRLQVTARALSEIAANSTGSNAGDQDLVPWGGSVDGYLAHAIAVGGAQLYVVDSGNTIIASSEVLPSVATGLSVVAPELSNAPWSEDVVVVNGMRFARFDIPGRPWRLIGGAPLVGMYGPIDSSNMVIRIAAGGGSGLGLLTVILVGSISRNREVLRESEELRRHRQELTVRAYQLEAANAELKIANDRVADLVAMLSHDVRQPIATVIGLCELLIGDWLDASDDDKRGDVEKIAATAASMNNLVEEILTLTQLDGDTLLARPTPLNVRGVVNDVLTHMAPDRQAQVTVEIDPALRVLADPRHLHQILTNLVGNALKYGDPPVHIRATGAGGGSIEVSDSGEGVPAEFVPHLFDRYTRADSGVAPTKKGTGLGLYIVKQLALANNGVIAYRSAEPTGACFVLSLPLPPVEPFAAEGSPPED